jgi:S1-C subfamily serine protease
MPNPICTRHVVAALASCAIVSAAADPISPARFLPISHSVVRVTAQHDGGSLSVGSGVTVAPNIVATSCHVVREASEIRIGGAGGTWDVDAEYADVHHDICLLRVPMWNGKPVSLAAPDDKRSAGESVVALGFTGGVAITPRMGEIRALHDFEGGEVIEADAAFNSGSSGGGLFNAEGALIGLLTFRMRNSVESYYSVPVGWLREVMAARDAWAEVHPIAEGTPFWQGERDVLPAFMREAPVAATRLAQDPPVK